MFCFVVLLIFCHLIFIEKINLPWTISDPAYVEEIFPVFHVPKKSDFVSEETNTPPLFPPPRKVKYCFIFVRKTNGTLFTIMYLLFCSPIIIVRVCHSDWCSFRLYYSENTNLFFLTIQTCSLQYIGPILLIFNTMILPN